MTIHTRRTPATPTRSALTLESLNDRWVPSGLPLLGSLVPQVLIPIPLDRPAELVSQVADGVLAAGDPVVSAVGEVSATLDSLTDLLLEPVLAAAADVGTGLVDPIADDVIDPVVDRILAPVVEGVAAPVADLPEPAVAGVLPPLADVVEPIVEAVVPPVLEPALRPAAEAVEPVVTDVIPTVGPVIDEVLPPVVNPPAGEVGTPGGPGNPPPGTDPPGPGDGGSIMVPTPSWGTGSGTGVVPAVPLIGVVAWESAEGVAGDSYVASATTDGVCDEVASTDQLKLVALSAKGDHRPARTTASESDGDPAPAPPPAAEVAPAPDPGGEADEPPHLTPQAFGFLSAFLPLEALPTGVWGPPADPHVAELAAGLVGLLEEDGTGPWWAVAALAGVAYEVARRKGQAIPLAPDDPGRGRVEG